jgi:hypothetical protein
MMHIVQKYSRACTSSNLKCDERHSDTDILGAVALCGVPFGPLLLRAKYATTESTASTIFELKRAWLDVVAKTAFIKHWPKNISVKKVTATSIAHWMCDVCPECKGRKSDQIDNTPCLTGVDCTTCQGTGKVGPDCDREHMAYVIKMAYALDEEFLNARSGAVRALGRD